MALQLGENCLIPGDEGSSLRLLYIAIGGIAGAVIGGLCIFATCMCIINTAVLKSKDNKNRKRDAIQETGQEQESEEYDYGDKW